MLGTAAGCFFALQAAFTEPVVGDVGNGIAVAVGHWQLFALLATALVGFVLWLFALRPDVLAPAMASSNAASLFGGVLTRGRLRVVSPRGGGGPPTRSK